MQPPHMMTVRRWLLAALLGVGLGVLGVTALTELDARWHQRSVSVLGPWLRPVPQVGDVWEYTFLDSVPTQPHVQCYRVCAVQEGWVHAILLPGSCEDPMAVAHGRSTVTEFRQFQRPGCSQTARPAGP